MLYYKKSMQTVYEKANFNQTFQIIMERPEFKGF